MKKFIISIFLSFFAQVMFGQVYTVTISNGNNWGTGTAGSFTWAVEQATAFGAGATIEFDVDEVDLSNGGTLNLNAEIAGTGITIDGSTAPSGRVEIYGGATWGVGLRVTGDDNTFIDLALADAVNVDGGSTNEFLGCYFGTDVTGLAATTNPNANANYALILDNGASSNTFGGNNAGEECVFAYYGNKVQIENASNGNGFINCIVGGLGIDGETDIASVSGNTSSDENGFLIDGSSATIISGGVISNNGGHGIRMDDADNTVVGSTIIGLNLAGTARKPNGQVQTTGLPVNAGVNAVNGSDNLTLDNVTISGNEGNAVLVESSNGLRVFGSQIGVDPTGLLAFGNKGNGIVVIGGQNHTVGGDTPAERNIVSANGNKEYPSVYFPSSSVVEGNKAGHGIEFRNISAGTNVIAGNYVGLDATGNTFLTAGGDSLGNQLNGIYIHNSSNVTVGGTTAGSANYVGGNGYSFNGFGGGPGDNGRRHGIQLDGENSPSTNNTVIGNYSGIGVDGTSDIGNGQDGISVFRNSNSNTIGSAASPNYISNNVWGIFTQVNSDGNIFSGNVIEGNGNATEGGGLAVINGSGNNQIGLATAGGGNTIQNNTGIGLAIAYWGADAASADVTGNLVYNNLIDNNTATGIQIVGGPTTAQASSNTIGGTATNQANTITNNGSHAVLLENATAIQNRIIGNVMNCNNGQGIELSGVANNYATYGEVEINVDDADAAVISGRALNFPNLSTIHVYAIDDCTTDACKTVGNPNVQGKTYLGSTTINSSKEFTFTVPGGYTEDQLTVTATSPNGSTSEFASCYSDPPCVDPGTVTLTVGDADICADETATFTASASSAAPTGGFEYEFFRAPSTSVQGPNSSNTFTTNVAGDYYVIVTDPSLPATCSVQSTSNVTLTVNANPVITSATNNGPVCEGETITLAVVSDIAASYSWNGGAFSGANPTVTTDAVLGDAGTYTVTATATGTGCVSTANGSTIVVVNENPELNYNGNTSEEICEGEDISFTVTADAGGTVEWELPDASTFTGNTISITDAVLADDGTYTATATNTTTGCTNVSGDEIVIDLTVNENPELTYTGNTSEEICEGEDISFTVTADAGGTVEWELPDASTFTGNTIDITDAVLADGGTYTATATNTTTGCTNVAGDEIEIDLTINENPELTFNGDLTPAVCEGEDISFTVTADAGGTVEWELPDASTITGNTVTVTGAALSDDGTYTATATNTTTGCTTESGGEVEIDLTVNVLPTPAFSVSSTGPACSATGVEYTVSGGLPGSTFNWTVPSGATIQGAPDTDNQIFVDFGTNNGFVRVTEVSADNSSCTTTIETQITLIGCLLVADFEANATSVCIGETVTFTDLTTGTPDDWEWDFGAGATPATSTDQGPIDVVYSTAGQKTVSLIAREGPAIDDTIKTFYITVNELPTLTDIDVTSAGEVCEGESVTLTADPVNATSDYTWTIPAGATLTSGQLSGPGSSSITVLFPTASAAGDVTLTEETQNGCTDGTTQTQPIVVNENPELNYNGNTTEEICEGDDISFTVTADAGGTVSWELPDASTVTGSTIDITDAVLADAGIYTATATNTVTGCTNVAGDEVEITLVVNENPELTYTGNNTEEICEGDDISFTVTADAGGTVTWELPDASTFTGNTVDITDAVLADAGIYTATATNTVTGCTNVAGDEVEVTLVVNENPELTYSGDLNPEVCENDDISFTVTADAGGTVSWELPDASTTTGSTVTVTGAVLADAGTYTATATNTTTGCTTASGNEVVITLAVNTLPAAPTITGNATPDCEVNGEVYTATPDNSGSGATYEWVMPSFGTIVSTPTNIPTVTVDFGNSTTASQIQAREISAEGCVGDYGSLGVSLLNCNLVPDFVADRLLICEGETVTYTNTTQNAPSGTTYQWVFQGGSPSSAQGEGPHTVTYNSPGFKDVILSLGNTGSSPDPTENKQDYVFVKALPTLTDAIIGDTTVCMNDTGKVYNVSATAGSTYYWELGNGGASFRDDINVGDEIKVDFGEAKYDTLFLYEIDVDGCESIIPDTLVIWNDTIQSNPGASLTIDDVQQIQLDGRESEIGIGMLFSFEAYIPRPIEWTSSVDNAEITGNPNALLTTAIPTESPTYYILEVTNPITGCKDIDSVAIFIDFELIIPTGFTPNGDDENDVWEIWNIDKFPENKVEIYNRWGSLVWETTNYSNNSGWNGFNMNGVELPVGTYFYVVTINESDGDEPYSGPVTIIK